MSQFPLVHRSTCGSVEQIFALIEAVRITFWPPGGRNSQFAPNLQSDVKNKFPPFKVQNIVLIEFSISFLLFSSFQAL